MNHRPDDDNNNTNTNKTATCSAIGTTIHVAVTNQQALPEATELVRSHVTALDCAASRFHDSELTQLTRQADGKPHQVSSLLFAVIDEALEVAHDTDGLVTPTVGAALVRCGYDRDFVDMAPTGPPLRLHYRRIPDWRRIVLDRANRTVTIPANIQLDLGASAKAGCADRAAMTVAAVTEAGVLVNIGGDVAAAGPCPVDGWNIRIADTADAPPDAPSVTVAIRGGGLATSGTAARNWRRGDKTIHHLIDPATGGPAATCWRTVTATGSSCLQANAASTAAMILGAGATEWLTSRGTHARLVATTGEVAITSAWPAQAIDPLPVARAS